MQESNKQHFKKFKEELKKYNSNFSDEFLDEYIKLKIEFYNGLIENFDDYFTS